MGKHWLPHPQSQFRNRKNVFVAVFVFVYGPVSTGPGRSANPLFVPLMAAVDCRVNDPLQFKTTLPPTREMLRAPGAGEPTICAKVLVLPMKLASPAYLAVMMFVPKNRLLVPADIVEPDDR